MQTKSPTFDKSAVYLLIFSSIVSILLFELVMRFYIFGSNALSYSQMKSVRHVGKAGIMQASPHLDILWELKPNLNTQHKLWPLQTNSQGLRDKEYSIEKPENTFRIAVVGDSLTMAEGVPQESAYHSLLEEKFNQNKPELKYEFINFGVAGYSLVQYVSTIKRKVLTYKPDLILLAFCGANDSKLPNLDAFNRPYQVKSEGNGFFHFHSFDLVGNVYKDLYKKLRGRVPGYNADANYVEGKFQDIAQIAKESGVPIVIAFIENKSASTDFKLVQELAQKYGLTIIDGTKNFPKKPSVEHIIYLTDGHPNANANKILSENLYPELSEIISRNIS